MRFSFDDRPLREPSSFVGFAGNELDRRAEERSEDCVAQALLNTRARLLALVGGRVLMRRRRGVLDAWHTLDQAIALGADPATIVLLGYGKTGPVLAAASGIDPEALPDDIKAIDNRSVYTQGLVDPAGLGALAQAASLLAWNGTHRFCGRCGGVTEMRIGGYKRICTQCGAEHFPRTDPVVIMLAIQGDRCLLGRSPHFAPGMVSALAGFVEPGETIENAVRRETFEEAGIRLGRVVYHASQPWPFPHTLMIGCYGEALDDAITFDGNELEDCSWFERDAVLAMIAGAHPDGLLIPPPGAIATHLIRHWAGTD